MSRWPSLEAALESAAVTERAVFVYLHAPWCAPCRRLERDVFPRLGAELSSLIVAAVDLSERPEPGFRHAAIDWARRQGLDTPPSFALLSPSGRTIAAMSGYRSPPEMRLFLSLVDASANQQ